MLPSHETQHVEVARTLLIEQFKKKPVIQGFLDTYVRRLQDVEDVIWQIIDSRILATATDAQLETLGKLAGEYRLGRNDDDYRPAIRLRIRVNRSKGRIVDIIDVAVLADLVGAPTVIEYKFLGFEVDMIGQAGERYIGDLLSQTRAASSYGLLVASDVDGLMFDDAVSPDASIETLTDILEEFP